MKYILFGVRWRFLGVSLAFLLLSKEISRLERVCNVLKLQNKIRLKCDFDKLKSERKWIFRWNSMNLNIKIIYFSNMPLKNVFENIQFARGKVKIKHELILGKVTKRNGSWNRANFQEPSRKLQKNERNLQFILDSKLINKLKRWIKLK